MKNRIAQRMRARRARLGFERALAGAEPAMRHELMAAAARHDFSRYVGATQLGGVKTPPPGWSV